MSRRADMVLIAAFLILLLLASTGAAQETTMVPVTIDGKTVRLEMRIYKPNDDVRAPTLVFNHGSTGRGTDPALFTRRIDAPDVAAFFLRRGWAVVMPVRRGRGGSEGEYDEGFGFPRSAGYTCETATSVFGADRALTDIEVSMDAILAMPFVDRERVIMGGVSRGGILSVAYAGRRPQQLKGVINFVGGWLGTGCRTATYVNQYLFKRGSRYTAETIWLYADNDSFYPLSHSRQNFAAFQGAGGKGSFHEFVVPDTNGHYLFTRPATWGSAVAAYLERLGLPSVERDRP